MREYTIIDAHGNEFFPVDLAPPDEVWISGKEGGAWVPWSLARQYPEDVTLEEITADLEMEGVK